MKISFVKKKDNTQTKKNLKYDSVKKILINKESSMFFLLGFQNLFVNLIYVYKKFIYNKNRIF